MTFDNSVPRFLLSARKGSVEGVTRGDDDASRLRYDGSAPANRRVNVPFLHGSKSFSPPEIYKTRVDERVPKTFEKAAAGLADPI